MNMNRFLKCVIGACIGGGMAGVWFLVDMLTPEPWGDYLLFSLMAVVNMVIGWQVARLFGKSRETAGTGFVTEVERTGAKSEFES